MKNTLLCTTLAAALLASNPAFAAEAETPVVSKAPSARKEAFAAVSKEWQPLMKFGGNPIPHLDKLIIAPHSPAVSAQLMKAFGVPSLVSVKSLPAAPGMVAYNVSVPAQDFAELDGEKLRWASLDSKLELDKDGRNMTWNGVWPSLAFTDRVAAVTMTDMRFESTQQRTASDIWVGKMFGTLGQMSFSPTTPKEGMPDLTMLWDTIALQASIAERGKLVDISYDVNVKAIRMLGEQVDDMRIVSRGTSIDAKAFEVLSLAMAANPRSPDDKDLFGGNKKEIIAFAKNVGANGSALEIDEISAVFHGHKVMISGRVSLAPLKDADFKNAAAFSSKVTARLEVTAPVGLVTEIAAIMARQQAKAKEQVVSEEAVAQMAQMMTDGMVGKVTSSGFATLKDGMLSAIVEFKGGKMTVNNKVIELPKAKPAATPAAKPASRKKK